MNTVKTGDNFEKKCKVIITKAINNSEFGISPSFCTIYEKKKYYSIKRNGDIIFDLVIEVKPPKAKKPFLVCIIECKNLNKAVPVDDIEEFESKVSGLQGFQTKKIFIYLCFIFICFYFFYEFFISILWFYSLFFIFIFVWILWCDY